MINRRCTYCTSLAIPGKTRCKTHLLNGMRTRKVQRERKPNVVTDEHRMYNRFYATKTWFILRDAYLVRHPECEACANGGVRMLATKIDHIIPRRLLDQYGVMETGQVNSDNLQALCSTCHQRKSNMERSLTICDFRRRKTFVVEKNLPKTEFLAAFNVYVE